MRISSYFNYFVWLFLFVGMHCITAQAQNNGTEHLQIAFMADVHFQDIYGQFSDTDYKGVKNPLTGEFHTLRTMNAQLHSTRIFNENYFAFKAALEDVVARGIKIVVLPGDFSDDGQPVHIQGLKHILQSYADMHGIQFLAITGNHDPVRPHAQEGTKTDFLGENGMEQTLTSNVNTVDVADKMSLSPIVTRDIREMGYEAILGDLSHFGFSPKKEFLYWETPYSEFGYDTYSYEKACEAATVEHRQYTMNDTDIVVPDASYLVEPIPGIWFMALDGNVYKPQDAQMGNGKGDAKLQGAGTGHNDVLKYKSHLLDWVAKVAREAQKRNKLLVAFSHYPMVEFNDGSTEEMKLFFGKTKMQLSRVPHSEVAEAFANAGLKIHFGGHMHINDTGLYAMDEAHTLFNIQVPSLAAYMPAYKILTVHDVNSLEVSTVPISHVPEFDTLFSLYRMEYAHRSETSDDVLWDSGILDSKSYGAFVEFHLKELLRLRFIPEDWPNGFADYLMQKNGAQLLESLEVRLGKARLRKELARKGMRLSNFKEWTGLDMIYDYYRLRGADELAIPSIGKVRMEQYLYVCEGMALSYDAQAKLWASIFTKTAKAYPADHFMIDFSKNQIFPIK